MPEHVTEREFAALCFRILGVLILLSGLAQALLLVPNMAQADWSSWGMASLMAMLMSLVVVGAIALPLIFHSESLVAWLIPKSEKTIGLAVSRRDLLMCGFALVGAWILAGNLPYLARLAAEVIWQAESSRRAQLDPEFFGQVAWEALNSFLASVVGWALFRYSRRIADWWESRAAVARADAG